eukprot:Pgem_evm1s8145
MLIPLMFQVAMTINVLSSSNYNKRNIRERRVVMGGVGETLIALASKQGIGYIIAHGASVKTVTYSTGEHISRALFKEYSGFEKLKTNVKEYLQIRALEITNVYNENYNKILQESGEEAAREFLKVTGNRGVEDKTVCLGTDLASRGFVNAIFDSTWSATESLIT